MLSSDRSWVQAPVARPRQGGSVPSRISEIILYTHALLFVGAWGHLCYTVFSLCRKFCLYQVPLAASESPERQEHPGAQGEPPVQQLCLHGSNLTPCASPPRRAVLLSSLISFLFRLSVLIQQHRNVSPGDKRPHQDTFCRLCVNRANRGQNMKRCRD